MGVQNAELVSALHSHCRGQGFDSPMLHAWNRCKITVPFLFALMDTEIVEDNGHIFGYILFFRGTFSPTSKLENEKKINDYLEDGWTVKHIILSQRIVNKLLTILPPLQIVPKLGTI